MPNDDSGIRTLRHQKKQRINNLYWGGALKAVNAFVKKKYALFGNDGVLAVLNYYKLFSFILKKQDLWNIHLK